MTVIAIIGVLTVLTVSVVPGIVQSARLRTAANLVADQLVLAWQTALARNCRVEVRFYELEDPNGSGGPAYRALRACQVTDTGIIIPLSKLRMLPSPVVISDKADENTVFRNGSAHSGTEDLPQASGTSYFKLSFLPSGRTDFDPGSNWFMTLYQRHHPEGQMPDNYVVVQIDDFTGHVRLYRP